LNKSLFSFLKTFLSFVLLTLLISILIFYMFNQLRKLLFQLIHLFI